MSENNLSSRQFPFLLFHFLYIIRISVKYVGDWVSDGYMFGTWGNSKHSDIGHTGAELSYCLTLKQQFKWLLVTKRQPREWLREMVGSEAHSMHKNTNRIATLQIMFVSLCSSLHVLYHKRCPSCLLQTCDVLYTMPATDSHYQLQSLNEVVKNAYLYATLCFYNCINALWMS